MQNYSPKHGSKHLVLLYFSNADMWWGCPCFSPHLGFRPKHGLEKGLTLEKKRQQKMDDQIRWTKKCPTHVETWHEFRIVLWGHVSKHNNSSAERRHFPSLGGGAGVGSSIWYPPGITVKFLKTYIATVLTPDKALRWGHSQNNQPLAFSLGVLIFGMSHPGALLCT